MSLIQLKDLIGNYLSNPYSTVVELGFGSLDFPSVTICNQNPIRITEIEDVDKELFCYLSSLAPNSQGDCESGGGTSGGRTPGGPGGGTSGGSGGGSLAGSGGGKSAKSGGGSSAGKSIRKKVCRKRNELL